MQDSYSGFSALPPPLFHYRPPQRRSGGPARVGALERVPGARECLLRTAGRVAALCCLFPTRDPGTGRRGTQVWGSRTPTDTRLLLSPSAPGCGQSRFVLPSLTLLSNSIFTFFWEMLFWILLLKLALPAARLHRSPSSRRQHSCPGPGPAAPGGPAAETAPAPGTSAPAPAPAPFPADAAAAAAATTAATAAAASPPRLTSSGVKPFMSPHSQRRADRSPALRAACLSGCRGSRRSLAPAWRRLLTLSQGPQAKTTGPRPAGVCRHRVSGRGVGSGTGIWRRQEPGAHCHMETPQQLDLDTSASLRPSICASALPAPPLPLCPQGTTGIVVLFWGANLSSSLTSSFMV